MKITHYIVALLLTVPFNLWAVEEEPASGGLSEDQISDIRSECISDAVAEDLEDDQKDAFVENCVNDSLRAKNASGEGQD